MPTNKKQKGELQKKGKKLLQYEIKEFNDAMKTVVKNGQKQHGKYYGAFGDVIPNIPFSEDMSFEENLKRLFAVVRCAYSDSMFFISQYRGKEEETLKIREDMVKTARYLLTRSQQ